VSITRRTADLRTITATIRATAEKADSAARHGDWLAALALLNEATRLTAEGRSVAWKAIAAERADRPPAA
jgi:hypothetical protein